MRLSRLRPAFSLFQLLALLAILLLALGIIIAATGNLRVASARASSMNNLKQLLLATHNYADANGKLPPGVDDNHFSTVAYLLPYIEQAEIFRRIEFKEPITDKANEAIRATRIQVVLSPLDELPEVKKTWGATNYLWNDQVFFLNSTMRFNNITDGTSNTVAAGETLKGDNSPQAVSVLRQHVLLKKEDLKDLKDDAGVAPFKADRNIASDRCASWMDGRFLQGTFNARLRINDERPDVSCAGAGGLSALRTTNPFTLVALLDGSVRAVQVKVNHDTWKGALTPAGGEVLRIDW